MTTIDRRTRVERWIEYWVPAGACAKDVKKILISAAEDWNKAHPDKDASFYDDWYTIHPHDEHVIIRIKCPDETA